MEKSKNITSITTILLLAFSLLASSTLLAALLAVGLPASVAEAKPASVLLQEGLYAEEIEGDLDAASKIYEQIAADKSADSRYAAQAMYRLGVCYQKKQDYQKAKATFEKLIARFPKQKAIIEKVQPLLAQMSTQDPAALMPPETLVYLEIGSPGKQIETILNMLKGTPFANPLAAINPGQKSRGTKSPGDILAALMNPSMMAEFKKIRGMAIGFQGVSDNNPPLVAVLYPGESDALRGMIIAGLGIALQPGEVIEGMQTLRMGEIGGVAYDDNVIILALPIKRLVWCVKQYEGITNEPTLASQNKAFQKLSRKVREQNAVTIWADVNKVFPSIKEGMPDEQRLLIEGIGDIGNVDAFTACLSIEESGLAVETNIGFKDGHNCLAYNLIRTPNLSKAGFEAVPPQAVGVVSFALGESEGAGVAGEAKAVKKLTGLDIGRELFANIEQITLFALPPSPASSEHILAESISPIVPCLGLAVTSHNPQKTHRLFTQLLTMADLIGSMNEESEEHISPTPGKYKIGMFDDEPAYCYMGQAGKSTILTLSPEVLQASLSSLKSGKSALSAGPLQEVLSKLPPDASKLVAINAGGAMGLADVHICKSLGARPDPNRNSLSQLFGQLAQACGKTTVQVRTNEKPNNFNLNVGINNIPQLGPIFPLLAQIPRAMENPMLCATDPRPADRAMVRPGTALELSWGPDRDATAHKVYFGTDIDKLSLLGEVETPSYDKLPTPERGITYYWRVDEVRADGSIITGDIWSFGAGKLVAWWKFDEKSGLTVADSSGNDYHGTMVHGNPIWNPDGKSDGCLDFNERYGISIPKEVFSSINKAITISVWVNGDENQMNHDNVILQAGAGRHGRPYIVTVHTKWKENGEVKFITREAKEVGYNAALDEWAGRWNHYAFVKDADEGFMRIYVNGRLVAEQTGTTASMGGVGAARIGIAPDRFGDQYVGKMDDFRIYNYALSAEEIQQLCGVVPDLGPVVEPIEPRPPAPQAPSYLKGLVGYWKFDEGKGSRARDSAGNYDGTLKGPKWTTGPVGSALEFGGKDAVYLQGSVGRESLLNIYNRDLTISSWVKIRGNGGTIVARATRGSTAYRLAVTASTALIDVYHSQHWILQTDEILQQDTWYHIVGVFDRSRKRASVYVNGIRKAKGAFMLRSASINESTKIGCRYPRGETFDGTIDEVMIFNRALSAEEIQELYAAVSGFGPVVEPVEPRLPAPQAPGYLKGLVGHWKFDEGKGSRARDSARNYDGTLKGTKWTAGRLGGALEFDGNDGVYLEGSVGTDSLLDRGTRNLTISSWVKIRGGGGTIVARATRESTSYRLGVTDNRAYIDIHHDQHWVLRTAPILQPDTWHHIVGVFDRSQKRARLYVDGIERTTGALTKSSCRISQSTKIGCKFSTRDDSFKGAIDEVMIFNRALSAEEIQELYTKVSGFRPVADVVIADIGDPSKAALYDFDARRLVRIPDPLRNAGSEERHGWIAREGLDVGATFAGEEYGLIAVDVVATRIPLEQWDKITPAKLRQALAAEPIGVEKGDWGQAVMPAKGEYPPTFAFRTREGGAGVLQIIDADRSKKTIRFRYKMLQPEVGKPLVKLELAKPVYEWWRAEPKVTKTIYENSQLEIEWDVDPEMGKNILSFGGGVLPIEGDISDIKGHLWWVNHLAFTVRSTPYGKNWDITEGPKPLKSGEYKIYICAFKSKEYFAWRDMLRNHLIGAGTAKLIVKQRPYTELALAEPGVSRKVFLPDADTPGVNVVLDLASGELLPAGTGKEQLTVFREMGKGDLAYDRALICLRAGKAKLLQKDKLANLEIFGQMEDSTAYKLLKTPCSLVITTAEGDNYEVTVMSADDKGAKLQYKKMLAQPAPRGVQANPTEAMQRIGDLHNLVMSVGDAVKRGDCGTALPLLTELLRMAEEWKASIEGIQTAEACVDAAIAKLADVRKALENDDDRTAKIAFEELERTAPTLWTTFQAAMSTAIRKQWQMETETVPGFGQARVRLILSATKHHDNLVDLDTGQSLSGTGFGTRSGVYGWARTHKADVVYNGPISGLDGIDMVAVAVANEDWYAMTPDSIRKQLASGVPATPAAMGTGGMGPATYVFKTREGGLGILQLIDSDQQAMFRYKMVQETTEPVVQAARREVFLPDADTPGVNAILDLASGELLPAGEGVHQLTVFREMGKGDLAYDRAFICLRGGKAKLLQAGKLTNLKIKGQIEDSTAYQLPGTPCCLVVTTAEGDAYEVKVLSVEGDEAGIHIEYWKSAEAPAEFTGVVQVIHPDSAMKLSRLGKAVVMYAADHNGKLPGTLQELKPYLGGEDLRWLIENVRYFGKGQERERPDTPIAYDKTLLEKGNGTNVLFSDAHVRFLQPEELERLGIATFPKEEGKIEVRREE